MNTLNTTQISPDAIATLERLFGSGRHSVCERLKTRTLALNEGRSSTVLSATTQAGVSQDEVDRLFRHPKVKALGELLREELGAVFTPDAKSGIVTTAAVRIAQRAGITDLRYTVVVLPLNPVCVPRCTDSSAALLVVRNEDAPGLMVARVLFRRNSSDSMPSEYALHRNGALTEMPWHFGECMFQSSLRLLEKLCPCSFGELRAALNASGNTQPISNVLKAVYDVRENACGPHGLLNATSVLYSRNLETEWSAHYISKVLGRRQVSAAESGKAEPVGGQRHEGASAADNPGVSLARWLLAVMA